MLAHELVHVVQQARSPKPTNMMPAGAMTAGDDPLEREAKGAAARIDASQTAFVSSGHPAPGLQRQAGPAQGPQADDCSGWEQDPESLSIHVRVLSRRRKSIRFLAVIYRWSIAYSHKSAT